MRLFRHHILFLLILLDTGGLAQGVGLKYPCADTLDVYFIAEARIDSDGVSSSNWHLTRNFILSLTESLFTTVRSLHVTLVVYGGTAIQYVHIMEDQNLAIDLINSTEIYRWAESTAADALQKSIESITDEANRLEERQAIIFLVAMDDAHRKNFSSVNLLRKKTLWSSK